MTTSVLKRPASGQGYSLGYAKRSSETLTFEVQALGLESVWDMGNSHVDLQEWVGLLLGDDRPAECLGTQKGFRFGFDFTECQGTPCETRVSQRPAQNCDAVLQLPGGRRLRRMTIAQCDGTIP